jgi:hypothetical protein
MSVLVAPGFIQAEIDGEIEKHVAEEETSEVEDIARKHLDRAEKFWAELEFKKVGKMYCVRS